MLSKFILNDNLNFFFLKPLNLVYVSDYHFGSFFFLPSFYFFAHKSNELKFIFINKFFFKSFLAHFKAIYISFFFFFFF